MFNLNSITAIALKVREEVNPLLGTTKAGEIHGRGAGGDKTKFVDKLAEDIIFTEIQESGEDCTAISEEFGIKQFGNPKKAAKQFIVIDSVDGTNNAVRGVPFSAVSIAVSDGGRTSSIYASVVVDLYRGEVFAAEKGKGSRLNGRQIRTSKVDTLDQALIGIDLSSPPNKKIIERLTPLILRSSHTRHLGSNALEMCYLAAGRIDAFVDFRRKLRVTDIAAAFLIVREAGGLVTDENGHDLDVPIQSAPQKVAFVATTGRNLFSKIAELVNSHKRLGYI